LEKKESTMEKMSKHKNIYNFFKNKKILITGHTGFVGSWLTLYLLKFDCEIYGVSKNLSNKNNIFNIFKLKKKIFHNIFDLTKKKKTLKFFKYKKFDFIVHLAAEPIIYNAILNPEKTIQNNIISTLNLLEGSKTIKKKIFLNFTTDKVYENKDHKNFYFKEKDNLYGDDPYSFSKSCSDSMLRMWSNTYKNKTSKYLNIRSGNIIGGGDWNNKRIITDITKFLFMNKKIFIRNPKSIRPWIHIIEVCHCISLLLYKSSHNKKMYASYNIGPNKNDYKNIEWIFNKLKLIMNNKTVKIKKNKKIFFNEKKNLRLDNNSIKKFLKINFKTSLTQRLQLTLDWYYAFFKNKKKLRYLTTNQIKLFEL